MLTLLLYILEDEEHLLITRHFVQALRTSITHSKNLLVFLFLVCLAHFRLGLLHCTSKYRYLHNCTSIGYLPSLIFVINSSQYLFTSAYAYVIPSWFLTELLQTFLIVWSMNESNKLIPMVYIYDRSLLWINR